MTAVLVAPTIAVTAAPSGLADTVQAVVSQLVAQINNTFGNQTINTVNNAAGQTITAAQIAAGVYIATARGAAQTDTTDTAVNLFANIHASTNLSNSAMLSTAFRFRYINGSANAVTIAGGTGMTVTGTGATAVAAAAWQDYIVTFQSATAATFTTIGKGTYA